MLKPVLLDNRYNKYRLHLYIKLIASQAAKQAKCSQWFGMH